ncbi:MAG: endonuclease/exonuclease/phosphatase family protein, partial [Bacteroidales bacterium]|nr:endonuclease/exonuclease/phosphatase family protein [Bacteroidales bacterium]
MRNLLFLVSSVFILITACNTSEKPAQHNNPATFTIAFYNVENLFDTISIEGKSDDEFTPSSKKKWNTERYQHKLMQISSVIDSIGAQYLPDVVALEEVENRAVLEDLVKQESIAAANYQIIHHESPDFRGIDNALLYNPKTFQPIFERAIPINMPDSINSLGDHSITTRDILYVKGVVYGRDTLHIFVNHWTSMYYGKEETVSHRKYCAMVLKGQVDSLLAISTKTNIIMGGDFNEDVFSPAVMGVMNPDTLYHQAKDERIYNLSHYLFTEKEQGTYNYRGVWGTLDHL